MRRGETAMYAGLIGFGLGLIVLGFATEAEPHEAASGWDYPFACCSGYDCRPMHDVPGGRVKEGPDGYVISTTGEVIGYKDSRVRHSPDGIFHWCSVAGKNDGRTLCLFVPPRAF